MNEVNDPKGAAGALKAPLGLIPSIAMEHTSWVHLLGSKKYGPFNWRKTGVCATTYVNAILRHLNAWREGEDNDQESGITHLAHIACCCNILMDAQRCGTLQDDRNVLPLPTQVAGDQPWPNVCIRNAHLMPDAISMMHYEPHEYPPDSDGGVLRQQVREKFMEAEEELAKPNTPLEDLFPWLRATPPEANVEQNSEPLPLVAQREASRDAHMESLHPTTEELARRYRERAKERAQKIYLQMAEEKKLTSASAHGNVQPSPVTGTTKLTPLP